MSLMMYLCAVLWIKRNCKVAGHWVKLLHITKANGVIAHILIQRHFLVFNFSETFKYHKFIF